MMRYSSNNMKAFKGCRSRGCSSKIPSTSYFHKKRQHYAYTIQDYSPPKETSIPMEIHKRLFSFRRTMGNSKRRKKQSMTSLSLNIMKKGDENPNDVHDDAITTSATTNSVTYNGTTSSSLSAILRGTPQPDPIEYTEMRRTKSKPFRQAVALGWGDYKQTWEGFFDNLKEKEEKDKVKSMLDIDVEDVAKKQKDLRTNIKRNVEVLREEGQEILDTAQNLTGIRNKQDLVKWTMVQLKLANECVSEFMTGYRKGRDDEIDKMMNVYFKEYEADEVKDDKQKDEGNKAGRRRRRRISKW